MKKHATRNASIKCINNVSFATLDRENFNKSLGKIETKRLNK